MLRACVDSWQHALALVGEMHRAGIPRSRPNCNALMRACEQAGAHAAARRALVALFPVREDRREGTLTTSKTLQILESNRVCTEEVTCSTDSATLSNLRNRRS